MIEMKESAAPCRRNFPQTKALMKLKQPDFPAAWCSADYIAAAASLITSQLRPATADRTSSPLDRIRGGEYCGAG